MHERAEFRIKALGFRLLGSGFRVSGLEEFRPGPTECHESPSPYYPAKAALFLSLKLKLN